MDKSSQDSSVHNNSEEMLDKISQDYNMDIENVTNLLKRTHEGSSEVTSDNTARDEATPSQVSRSKSSKRIAKRNKSTKIQNLDQLLNHNDATSTTNKNRFEILSSTRRSDIESGEEEEILSYDKHYIGPYLVLAKYKIGNRTTKRLSAFEAARKLSKANIKYDSLEDYSFNTWKLIFKSRSAANLSLTNRFVKEQEITTFIPRFRLFRKGVINRIPLDIPLDELQTTIEDENSKLRVNKLFRLKRKDKETKKWVDSSSVCIEFKHDLLPEKISIWKILTPVSVYVPAVKLCFKCGQLGHISKTCSRPEICLNCSNNHPKEKDKPCNEKSKCVNCGQDHKVFDRNCPALKRKREITSIMAHKNIPFFEARRLIDRGGSTPPASPLTTSNTSSNLLHENIRGSQQTTKKSFADIIRDANRFDKPPPRESFHDIFPIFSKLETNNISLLKGLAFLGQILSTIPEGDKQLALLINRVLPDTPCSNDARS